MATQTETIVAPASESAATIPLAVLETTLTTRSRAAQSLDEAPAPRISRLQEATVVLQLSGVNLCTSAINGCVIVGLPTIAADLGLPESLAFWPSSATSLGTASALLLAGSIADAFGARAVDLVGCFTVASFMLGAAGATTGQQLVAMRAIQGVGAALHLSSSVALVTQSFAKGKGRNIAFACLGLSQPLGFSFGLVAGGVLVDAAGWRVGWYLFGGICLFLSFLGLWALPHGPEQLTFKQRLLRAKTKIDWIGALLASSFMAMLCYLLAVVSSDLHAIRNTDTIVLLCLSVVMLPCFIGWMYRQQRRGRPALIPNLLWKNASFSAVCGITALSFAAVNAVEIFSSLFFQEIQHLSALQTSLRILPNVIVGVLLGLTAGFFVDKIHAFWLVSVSSILSSVASLLMAVIRPEQSYWTGAFQAQLLCPLSANMLFTVGLIIISDVFNEETQALAGAVFNTSVQFGTALGLAVVQIISTSVTRNHSWMGETRALLHGYRASLWASFGFMIVCVAISALGLRRAGKVGLKQE